MTAPMYYNTDFMLAAIEKKAPVTTFLLSRYFPDNELGVFATGDVLIEYQKNGQNIAPFVVPYIGGIPMERKGYESSRYTPANIEPSRTLTIEDAMKKGFGEAIVSNLTPEQRAITLLGKDLKELDDAIARTKETMAASVLLNNKIVMTVQTGDSAKPKTEEIRYYKESANPLEYAITTKWDAEGADFIDDLEKMYLAFQANGQVPEDLIVTASALKAMRNNKKFIELLDNRNYDIGKINPTGIDAKTGAAFIGKLNLAYGQLNIITYVGKYTDTDGSNKFYIPDGKIILAVPGCGQTVYGAVTQMEDDEKLHTYVGKRVPQRFANKKAGISELKLTSKPLLAPKVYGGFMSATAVTVS